VLQAYYDEFFIEEERRIGSSLKEASEAAQELAGKMELTDLFEELSRGVRYEELPQTEKMVLVPTYWLSPLVTYSGVDESCMLWLFGARPQGEALVPGEVVPDDLLAALKALADPTRLRILRYLMQEQLTPAELSRRLRLRAPTVTHHLHTLRLAGLVRFVLRGKNERLYFARLDSVKNTYAQLKKFLEEDVGDELEELADLQRRRTL
jgi:DNA-binding transcriptional ArsR family regulator